MIDIIVCDHPQSGEAYPFPVDNILTHCGRLQLDFLAEIKNLKCSLICLKGDDLALPVHDGTVGLDRPPCELIVFF